MDPGDLLDALRATGLPLTEAALELRGQVPDAGLYAAVLAAPSAPALERLGTLSCLANLRELEVGRTSLEESVGHLEGDLPTGPLADALVRLEAVLVDRGAALAEALDAAGIHPVSLVLLTDEDARARLGERLGVKPEVARLFRDPAHNLAFNWRDERRFAVLRAKSQGLVVSPDHPDAGILVAQSAQSLPDGLELVGLILGTGARDAEAVLSPRLATNLLVLDGTARVRTIGPGLTLRPGGEALIQRCADLERIDLPLIGAGKLQIANCPKLVSFGGGIAADTVRISGCPALCGLPPGLRVTGNLTLDSLAGLVALPAGLQVGGTLTLAGCPAWDGVLPSGLDCHVITDAFPGGLPAQGYATAVKAAQKADRARELRAKRAEAARAAAHRERVLDTWVAHLVMTGAVKTVAEARKLARTPQGRAQALVDLDLEDGQELNAKLRDLARDDLYGPDTDGDDAPTWLVTDYANYQPDSTGSKYIRSRHRKG
jgi:hypothetical protein